MLVWSFTVPPTDGFNSLTKEDGYEQLTVLTEPLYGADHEAQEHFTLYKTDSNINTW